MKKSNTHFNKQYYTRASRSQFSNRSSRRLDSQVSSQHSSKSISNRLYRIDKACLTFNETDLKKQNYLIRKQLQKLQRQLLKKDKQIFQLQQYNNQNKQLSCELIELYRVLYMYEGKMQEYEKEVKKLEIAVAGQLPKDVTKKVEELLESYRVDNAEMSGRLKEKEKIVVELEEKLKRIENKYFSATWKLSSTKRENNNPLKKRFPNLRNTVAINQTPLLEKEKALKVQAKGGDPLSEYQIKQVGLKEKETVRFKRVEAPDASPDERQAPRFLNAGNLKMTKAYSTGDQLSLGLNKKAPAIQTPLDRSNPLNNSSASVRYSLHSAAPVSIKPVDSRPLPSSPNINSQMTISNGGTIRRIQSRETGKEGQRVEMRSHAISPGRYELGKSMNEVDLLMKNPQSRGFQVVNRGATTSQSIYMQ